MICCHDLADLCLQLTCPDAMGHVLEWTHSADARGKDHPAPFDEEDWLVANHVLNVGVEPVTSWKTTQHVSQVVYGSQADFY